MMTLILISKGILKEKLRWISSLINSRMREHFINQSVKVLPQISGLRIWCPSRKFGHEINLKSFVVFSTVRLKNFKRDF